MKKPIGIYIIVPFYNNPHLVEILVRGLLECGNEIRRLNCEYIFINDSPDNLQLARDLEIWMDSLSQDNISGLLITNEKNLGFIKSTNKGLSIAIENNYDVLLLNSDAILYPGCIEEMRAVAYLDEMIGFVSPRSNEAGLATIPHLATSATRYLTREAGFKAFLLMSSWLPRLTFTPTAVGFCLLIKNHIIREFGVLDETYGKGYNEENDLILRANRYGYRAALANYAYCWHESSVSFGKSSYINSDLVNRKILDERYPEYGNILNSYYKSPSYKAENIISGFLVGSEEGVQHIALNLSNIGPNYNGTVEMALNIARVMSEISDIRLHFITDDVTAKFHNFGRYGYIDQKNSDRRYAAVIHVGQPFKWQDVFLAANRAPVNAYFMLDTIAQDCGYLHNYEVDKIWQFIAKNSDAIFYISNYSKKLFNNRFYVSPNVRQVVSMLPTHPESYIKIDSREGKHFLVIGNHYAHKAIPETVEVLSTSFPLSNIVVLGASSDRNFHNVTFIKSGLIDELVVESLYAEARAIIFPSHYEGFGFPMVKAVAYGKPVFVRDTELAKEISERIKDSHYINRYSFTEDLPELLLNFDCCLPADKYFDGQITWGDVGIKIATEIINLISSPDTGIKIRNRIFDLSLLDCTLNNSANSKELLGVYNSKSWRLTKPLRVANKIFRDNFLWKIR